MFINIHWMEISLQNLFQKYIFFFLKDCIEEITFCGRGKIIQYIQSDKARQIKYWKYKLHSAFLNPIYWTWNWIFLKESVKFSIWVSRWRCKIEREQSKTKLFLWNNQRPWCNQPAVTIVRSKIHTVCVLHSQHLRTLPTIVTAHTFCASRDTRVSYRWCLLMQG